MPQPAPSARRVADWIAPALWFALGLTLARAAVLFFMEHIAHESPLELVRHRLGVALPGLTLLAAAIALATCGLGVLFGRGKRTLALLLVTPLGATAAWILLSGIGTADASRRVGLETTRGLAVAGALAAFALGTTFLALWLATRIRARTGSGLPRILIALAPLVLLAVGARVGLTGLSREMPLREVTLRPSPDDTWRTLRARPDAPPRAGTITPSLDYALDGADLPAVVLPPPAEVRFRAPTDQGLWLVGKAGIDHRAMTRFEEKLRGHAVRFQLAIDDRIAFEDDVAFERVGKWASTEWVELGEDGALEIPPGAEITLRTVLLDPSGAPKRSREVIEAGFGGLTFERRWSAPRQRSSPDAPNLVLILMDTQRKDRMSTYGYERATTPRLAQLAERGIQYENAHSTSSWTWPSTASVLTGQLPEEHGVQSEQSCFLDDELTTLAESLQQAGFTTGAFSANPLIVPDRNFHQGFEVFDHGRGAFRSSEVVLPPALDWLEAVAGNRFFLYLHLGDPHAPLEPRDEARAAFAPDVPRDLDGHYINDCHTLLMAGEGHTEDGELATGQAVSPEEQRWLSDLYDACVWTGDYHVGLVLDALERLGLSDETVVAYTSDHGEELFDHGFATHGQNLFGSLVDIPLIVAGPGLPRDVRIETPVSNRHIAPSLARLMGAGPLGPADALDLFSLPGGGGGLDVASEPVLFSTEKGWWNGRSVQPIHGLRAGDLVLHWAPEASPWGSEEPVEGGEWRLYDRASDPGEMRDVGAERAHEAQEMRATLERTLAELEARRATPAISAGSGTLEMLRAIGYIDDGE